MRKGARRHLTKYEVTFRLLKRIFAEEVKAENKEEAKTSARECVIARVKDLEPEEKKLLYSNGRTEVKQIGPRERVSLSRHTRLTEACECGSLRATIYYAEKGSTVVDALICDGCGKDLR
jgi:hypothetical protein